VAHEVASISLIEHLAEAGFRSSVIATYSCYFPFYEDVVLRRLMTAGCTHNVLMVDSHRCAEAFASEELRPRLAGRDYTLIPVEVGGAFHPKMFLRLGKSKGSLFVGSHNLTLSGFGLNDELTNAFRVEGSGVRSGGGPLLQALEYLAGFVPVALPEVLEAYEGLKHGVAWMDGPLGPGDPDRVLLTTSTTSRELWSQVAPLVPKQVSTAFVCGPFFDPTCAFLRRLLRDVRPQELVVGIDPSSVQVDPAEAVTLPGVRWVNVAGVLELPQRREGSRHYLHAKLLWFAGKHEELLITGSPNPSVAAFLAPANARNAEVAVACRQHGAGSEIGIDALLGAPPVTAADWTTVADRTAARPSPSTEPTHRVLLATSMPTGFRMQAPLSPHIVLQGVGDNGTVLGDAVVHDAAGLTIEASDTVRDGARYLDATISPEHLIVIVHRAEDIAKNLGGDMRKALRQALGALEEDPRQLETLLKLTEKVIFDSDDIVRTTPLRATPTPERSQDPGAAAASLALDATGKKSARKRRSLASGDILVLLDALMRRLGEGLPPIASQRPRNDQDEIGADEEEGGELAREAPDFEDLAKACRGKVRRLVKRMQRQFAVAAAPGLARRAVVQLAAVLGIIRTLRTVSQRPEWRRNNLGLVHQDDEWQLFKEAVLALTWRKDSLASRAIAEADGEWFDELSHVTGLLAWLGWDVDIDIEGSSSSTAQRDIDEGHWCAPQLLACLAEWIVHDEVAAKILADSVSRTPRYGIDGERWLRIHRGLLEQFALITADPDHHGRKGALPNPGDLVVLNESFYPRVRVILTSQTRTTGVMVGLFDPDVESELRKFVSSHVASLPWPRGKAPSAASA
jgi:hypothetical protein